MKEDRRRHIIVRRLLLQFCSVMWDSTCSFRIPLNLMYSVNSVRNSLLSVSISCGNICRHFAFKNLVGFWSNVCIMSYLNIYVIMEQAKISANCFTAFLCNILLFRFYSTSVLGLISFTKLSVLEKFSEICLKRKILFRNMFGLAVTFLCRDVFFSLYIHDKDANNMSV